jgi:hypothetical protein
LQCALTNAAIQPGDTIFLRGGNYFPVATFPDWNVNPTGWVATIHGTNNNLITIESYTNEWASIDRRWKLDTVSCLKFLNLEFYDSLKGHNLTNDQYPNGPWVHFPGGTLATAHFQWVNCVIHDVDDAFGGGAAGDSVRGCIFWHVGWNQFEHVLYGPPYNCSGNICGWAVNTFIQHSFTNQVCQNNIIFAGGDNLTGGTTPADLLLGSGHVISNYFYQPASHVSGTGPNVIAAVGDDDTYISNNVIVGGFPISNGSGVSNATVVNIVGNTMYSYGGHPEICWGGSSLPCSVDHNSYYSTSGISFYDPPHGYGQTFGQWQAYAPTFDVHSITNSTAPPDSVYVIPNQDQAKRCNMAIYNWTHKDNVAVNLAGVLNQGDTYELINAENYDGGAIQSGIYNGTNIMVPMTNLLAAPVLYANSLSNYLGQMITNPAPTTPEFGAFVVIGNSAIPFPPNKFRVLSSP